MTTSGATSPDATISDGTISDGTTAPRTLAFTKGHGTHNDFVLVDDRDGVLDLGPAAVRALADRRGGIGADGVIRLAPSAALPEGRALLESEPAARWFMDYRNGDGSVAEMCGNGVRVFAAFAESLGLADLGAGELVLGTRAGVRRVRKEPDGWYAVDMGRWTFPGGDAAVAAGLDASVQVRGWTGARPALSVDLGNPHTVVALGTDDELDALDLTVAPDVRPVPPHGTNVELVVPLGESVDEHGTSVGRVRMRVHERGVGETRSCGTGACAAALAVRAWAGGGAPDVWFVEVPGGTVRVTALADGHVELAGPAELVFAGTFPLVDGSR
ncbi:diaminopimelate epimerase [Sediminihabitans luteus]|uniref:Diaminopimelate epimerase n=1 Tax=Sediminihabitans luteus TaxID=1138585 RepID=A0A2M9CCD8_9CELL|nr:diaminopimelate epimerase [Sediminihabitans luteus]PJJ69052.1 diaminopimelate epimerase [Sediminihabitans luteus]GII99438.1 diaminopimelate epimerase [Sediminihabitans luteus]